MLNLNFRPDFEHRNVIMLNVKIGKYSIPYEYFITLDRIASGSDVTFNFYYYENEFREFLLGKRIIELDRNDVDTDWYKFKKYEKFKTLTETIRNLFELNCDELHVDYRNSKILSINDELS